MERYAGDLIEEGTVFEFLQAMLLGPGTAVDVVAGIGLGYEDTPLGVDGNAIEQRA